MRLVNGLQREGAGLKLLKNVRSPAGPKKEQYGDTYKAQTKLALLLGLMQQSTIHNALNQTHLSLSLSLLFFFLIFNFLLHNDWSFIIGSLKKLIGFYDKQLTGKLIYYFFLIVRNIYILCC